MPSWMEPYRDLITNTGGNSIERLMNLPASTGFSNAILASLAVACMSQVALLTRLHESGLLGRSILDATLPDSTSVGAYHT